MANQFLSLALFLMLLSFFIVMNAVSGFEDNKAKPVMNSLALAFSNQITEQEKAPSPETTPLDVIREGDTLESLEGLFNAHIAGFQSTRNRLGTVMHTRASVGQFENAIDMLEVEYTDTPIGTRGSFVQTMVTLLRSAEKGKPYRVDMILNTPENPADFQKKSPSEFSGSLKRVSGFAETLERAGLPAKMVSAGLAQGESGFIDLYFYPYKPFNLASKIKSKNGDL